MSEIEKLCEAISARKPVEFCYSKPGKTRGLRIAEPHVVYQNTPASGVRTTYLHAVQTGGESDGKERLPSWKMFVLDYITDVTVLHLEEAFPIDKGFNPSAPMYKYVLCKV